MADDLVFDAHFESGNLKQASRIRTVDGGMEYELVLNPDPSKKAHVQWWGAKRTPCPVPAALRECLPRVWHCEFLHSMEAHMDVPSRRYPCILRAHR